MHRLDALGHLFAQLREAEIVGGHGAHRAVVEHVFDHGFGALLTLA